MFEFAISSMHVICTGSLILLDLPKNGHYTTPYWAFWTLLTAGIYSLDSFPGCLL